MEKEPYWLQWLKKSPAIIMGSIALISAIFTFVVLIQSNIYLGITVLVAVILIGTFIFCLYIALAKKEAKSKAGLYVPKFDRYRSFALGGLVIIAFIVISLLVIKPTRTFTLIALVGTFTPTPTLTATPTNTSTPTITPSNTPSSTPSVTPTPLPIELPVALNVRLIESNDEVYDYFAELSIEPMGFGDLNLYTPKRMLLGESSIIHMRITPDSILENLTNDDVISSLTAESDIDFDNIKPEVNRPGGTVRLDDRIPVYPVMSAELVGTNFDIAPMGKQNSAVPYNLPTDWSWSIAARDIGQQTLILTISIPVVIDQKNQTALHTIKIIPIHLLVESPIAILPATSTPAATPTGMFIDPGTPMNDVEEVKNYKESVVGIIAIFVILSGSLYGLIYWLQRSHPMSGTIIINDRDHYESVKLNLPALNRKVYSRKTVLEFEHIGIKKLSARCTNKKYSERGIVEIKLEFDDSLLKPYIRRRLIMPNRKYFIEHLTIFLENTTIQ